MKLLSGTAHRKNRVWYYLWIITITIFAVELGVMYVLDLITFPSVFLERLADSVALVLVMFPVLYLLMLKPLLELKKDLTDKNTSYKTMIEVCREALLVVNHDGEVVYGNPAFFELVQRSPQELIGAPFGYPVTDNTNTEIHIRRPDNSEECIVKIRATPSTWNGVPTFLLSLHDVTEHTQLLREMEELASHDGLTGLYNHRIFYKQLEEELIRANRHKHPLSILLMDIDHFKLVNDTHGHLAGDAILIELGRVLTELVREIDRVCRYGGEEIAILLPETGIKNGYEIAERIRNVIASHHFDIRSEKMLTISVSIGVSSFPEQDNKAETLVDAADKALYRAKEGGRNKVCLAADRD